MKNHRDKTALWFRKCFLRKKMDFSFPGCQITNTLDWWLEDGWLFSLIPRLSNTNTKTFWKGDSPINYQFYISFSFRIVGLIKGYPVLTVMYSITLPVGVTKVIRCYISHKVSASAGSKFDIFLRFLQRSSTKDTLGSFCSVHCDLGL